LKSLLVLALLAAPVDAGPWCGGGESWGPVGKTIPVRAHLVYARSTRYYAGKPAGEKLTGVKATINGKPVKLRVKEVKTNGELLRFIDVLSDATGTLKLTYSTSTGDDPSLDENVHEYTIDPAWKAPDPSDATLTRYHQLYMGERRGDTKQYDGADIKLDAPAIAFTLRWRRDAKDTWRTLQLPVEDAGGMSAVRFGQTACAADTVPLAFLERGVELELKALLVDGTSRNVSGLPSPFVLPRYTVGDVGPKD